MPHRRLERLVRCFSGCQSLGVREDATGDSPKEPVPPRASSPPIHPFSTSSHRSTQEKQSLETLATQLIQSAQVLLQGPLSSQEQGQALLVLNGLISQMARTFNQAERSGDAPGFPYYQLLFDRSNQLALIPLTPL